MSFLSIGSARKWLKGNSHTRGLLPSRQVTGKHLPSLPPPLCLDFFFPFHYSPFDLSNPLPSFLNAPLPLPFSSLSSETQVPQIQVSEWMTWTSEVTVNEWLLPVMVSCHTTYHATVCMHTHTYTHAVRNIPIRYCSGVKIKRVSFLGSRDPWSTWQLRVPFCHGGVGAH